MADIEEKFVSDDGYSTAAEPITPAGGEIKAKKADVKKKVDPAADSVEGAKKAITPAKAARSTVHTEENEEEGEVVEELSVDESVASLFEGEELSENFKAKAALIFTAAINEQVAARVAEETKGLEEQFQEQLTESVAEAMEGITEALDGYLDYVVEEWMEENKLAIESGIKVEMAESFMEGLKGLFYEHNVAIDDETVDVVAGLEEELAAVKAEGNEAINEAIELKAEIASLKAERVFNEAAEGLTMAQADRLRTLSEKISHDDLDSYASDLETLKETFLNVAPTKKTAVESVSAEEEGEILTEEAAAAQNRPAPSAYPSIAAYAQAFSAKK